MKYRFMIFNFDLYDYISINGSTAQGKVPDDRRAFYKNVVLGGTNIDKLLKKLFSRETLFTDTSEFVYFKLDGDKRTITVAFDTYTLRSPQNYYMYVWNTFKFYCVKNTNYLVCKTKRDKHTIKSSYSFENPTKLLEQGWWIFNIQDLPEKYIS